MKNVILSSLLFLCVIIIYSFTTNNLTSISVCGTVVDENGQALIGVIVKENKTTNSVITNIDGEFEIFVNKLPTEFKVSYTGYVARVIKHNKMGDKLTIKLLAGQVLDEVVVAGYENVRKNKSSKIMSDMSRSAPSLDGVSYEVEEDLSDSYSYTPMKKELNFREKKKFEQGNYSNINENQFMNPVKNPLSTLSIDVDRASYANVRRFLNNGQFPPANSVRIEEMINYFDYDYEFEKQKDKRPFQTFNELAPCAWNSDHKLLKVGLKAQSIERGSKAGNNLVFLIDVSGSMNSQNKLPLLKSAFKLLVDQLTEEDRVSIVVYAGAAGVVLEPTNKKEEILDALNKLNAGGSTAGGAGIQLAYKIAKKNFISNGNNRVILATDGDFNVGTNGDNELVKLIENKRDDDIFLSILGFGTGNYMEGKMQKISSAGNGNHNYIDNMREAKKVLMDEFSGTLYTIAKDVKIQIEFNPQAIDGYRMIGYENRVLAAEDFNNDKKDAGEMGAGHTVTVLYEIIPKGVKSDYNVSIDPLKYQEKTTDKNVKWAKELATIKYRYKQPKGDVSVKSEEPIYNRVFKDMKISPSTEWASCVAEFGLLLRNSSFKGDADYDRLINKIEAYIKLHPDSYKEEMLDLVILAKSIGHDSE